MQGRKIYNKGKSGIFRLIFSRIGIILLLMIIQLMLLVGFYEYLSLKVPHFIWAYTFLTIGVILYVINLTMDASSKITWLIVIGVMPLFGIFFFLVSRFDLGNGKVKRNLMKILDSSNHLLLFSNPQELNRDLWMLVHYLNREDDFPIYKNTDITYLSPDKNLLNTILEELEKAEKYIFLEFFILDKGYMWDKILTVLKKKAAENVEVRLLYDGTCVFQLLPYSYPKQLEKYNIKCKMFSPIKPFLSTYYNYRDHRKMIVIDGKAVFTGGFNIADEYIGLKKRFGHWKDCAILLKGEAVNSFALMFLQMWSMDGSPFHYEPYINIKGDYQQKKGYVIPYADSPLDDDKVGKKVYLDVINKATDYLYIMTPYLILDEEMENALKFASERGVDVRIILPGIPDKKSAYILAKTYFGPLLASQVKLYTYTPGFVHSKIFLSDNLKAIVGTINLDYRSLYHHFECAVFMYDVDCIQDIYTDFEETFKKCHLVTEEDVKNQSLVTRLVGSILKIFSPLL